MRAGVQDVREIGLEQGLGYGFGIYDENGRIVVNIAFLTMEAAKEAAGQLRAIISKAVMVRAVGTAP